MALATLNGIDVLEARIHLPREGRWWADLALDTDSTDSFSGGATLQVGDELTLKGTTVRLGEHAGTVTLQMVGGAGGLMKVLTPKAYQGVPLRIPLQDALTEVGELLSPTSDPAVLNTLLTKWVRMKGDASGEVEVLLGECASGTVCRVLVDGTIWVGTETWPEAQLTYTLLEDHRWCGQVVLGVDSPSLLPGTTFLDRQVEHVEHRIGAREIRTVVQFADESAGDAEAPTTTDGDRLFQLIDRRIRPSRFRGLFPARVVKQNDDLTLELVLDDDIAPGLSNVPMRMFAPSVQMKVAPDSRCAVVFEGGDPQRPVATLFELGSLMELALNATGKLTINAPQVLLGDGTKPVALEGSATQGHSHTFLLSAPPNGGPVTGSINAATDIINTGQGSSKVKA
jgi:hypothetical protein